MKKMSKTVLSVLLAVLMLFSAFPLSAFAAETDAADTAADVEIADVQADEETPDAEADDADAAVEAPTEDAEIADTGSDEDIADTGAITVTGPVGVTGVTEPKNGYYPSYTGISVLNSSEYKINSSYNTTSYKNGIMWKDENGNYISPSSAPAFQTGKKYTVVIYLLPASSSYQWDQTAIKSKTNTVNGNAAKVGFWQDGGMYLEYTFTAYRRLTYVSANISVPVPGNAPSYSCTVGDSSAYYATGSDSYYKNGIKWAEDGTDMTVSSGKKFVAGKKYTVYIALKPQTNHKFAPKASLSGDINGNTATVGEWTEGSYIYLTKEYTCTAQKISSVTITGVTAPKIGSTPTYAATASGTGYKKEDISNSSGWTSGVKWEDSNGNKLTSTSKFEAGKSYKVRVSIIRTSEAYEFSSSVTAKINGNTATTSAWSGVPKTENFIAEYTFPTLTTTKITAAYAYGVTEPKPGNSPVFSASVSATDAKMDTYSNTSSGWKNGVKWEDADGNAMTASDKFIAGKKYTVYVSVLRMSEAYEFTSTTKGKINSVDCTVKPWSSSTQASNIVLSRTFTCSGTAVSSVQAVNVTVPVAGQKPTYSATPNGLGYGIKTNMEGAEVYDGVQWYDKTDGKFMTKDTVFKPEHEYKVNIYMYASTGYYFASTVTGKINSGTATASGVYGYDASQVIVVSMSFGKITRNVVTSVAVTGVTAPAIGASPVYSASESSETYDIYKMNYSTGNFSNGVRWIDNTAHAQVSVSNSSYKFIAGHSYAVNVMVKVSDANRFKFSSSMTGTVNGSSATVSKYEGSLDENEYRMVSFTFPALTTTKISSVAVTGVTAPKIGASPVFSATASGTGYKYNSSLNSSSGYKNGVKWEDESGTALTSTSTFQVGKKYKVKVVLDTVSDAYEFIDYSSVSAKLNGNTASTNYWDSTTMTSRIVVIYTFAALTATKISTVSVSGVTAPVAGSAPSYSIPSVGNSTYYSVYTGINADYSQYTSGSYWYDATDKKYVPYNDTSYRFIAGHKYQYNVCLKANIGYAFNDTLTGYVNGMEAGIAGYSSKYPKDTYRNLYYTFDALPKTKISSVGVKVTAPVGGQSREYLASVTGLFGYKVNTGATYTGSKNGVTWYKAGTMMDVSNTEKFVAGIKYICRVSLIPENDNYEFADTVTGSMNGNTATVKNQTAKKEVYIQYEFTATQPASITISSVAATVAEPLAGAARSYNVAVAADAGYTTEIYNSATYKNGVAWFKDGTLMAADNTEKYEAGHKYKVVIYLVPTGTNKFASTVTGKINNKNATVVRDKDTELHMSYEFTIPASGKSVTVKVQSYLKAEDVTVELKQGSTVKYTKTVKSAAGDSVTDVTFDNVSEGAYTMTVKKKDHVDRDYSVTMGSSNVSWDAKICPKGDISGDGKTTQFDSGLATTYAKRQIKLDPYQIKCGDVFGTPDGKVTMADAARITLHVKRAEKLY